MIWFATGYTFSLYIHTRSTFYVVQNLHEPFIVYLKLQTHPWRFLPLSLWNHSTAAVISLPLSRRFGITNKKILFVCSPASLSMTFGHANRVHMPTSRWTYLLGSSLSRRGGIRWNLTQYVLVWCNRSRSLLCIFYHLIIILNVILQSWGDKAGLLVDVNLQWMPNPHSFLSFKTLDLFYF